MEPEQIINVVHKYPLLYDTSHSDYKNNRKKDQVWDEIGRRHGISGENLKKRWKNLKDCYTKHLRSEQTHTGQKAKQLDRYRTWPWANQMSIFKRYLQLTPTDSNVPYLNDTQTISENSLSTQEILDEPSPTLETTETTFIVLSPPNLDAPSTNNSAPTFSSTEIQNTIAYTVDNEISRASALNEPSTSRLTLESETSFDNRSTPSSVNTSTVGSRARSRNSTQRHVSPNVESSTSSVLNYLKNRSALKPNYDDIDHICLGYAKTIKKFSAERQALVKFQMAKLLMEQELAHIRELSPITDRSTQDVSEYFRHFASDDNTDIE